MKLSKKTSSQLMAAAMRNAIRGYELLAQGEMIACGQGGRQDYYSAAAYSLEQAAALATHAAAKALAEVTPE